MTPISWCDWTLSSMMYPRQSANNNTGVQFTVITVVWWDKLHNSCHTSLSYWIYSGATSYKGVMFQRLCRNPKCVDKITSANPLSHPHSTCFYLFIYIYIYIYIYTLQYACTLHIVHTIQVKYCILFIFNYITNKKNWKNERIKDLTKHMWPPEGIPTLK